MCNTCDCYNGFTIKKIFFKSKRFKDGRCTYKSTVSSQLNRSFAPWRYFLQGFAFLCQLGLLFFKPRWNYQISRWNHKMWIWKDNANDSGHSRKMTASCKWPISFFFRRSWSEYWDEFWEYGRGKAAKIRNTSLVNVNCSGWAQVFHSLVKAPLLVLALRC